MIQGCVPFDELFRGAIYEFEKKTPKKSAIKRANTQIFDYDDDFFSEQKKKILFLQNFPSQPTEKKNRHFTREKVKSLMN